MKFFTATTTESAQKFSPSLRNFVGLDEIFHGDNVTESAQRFSPSLRNFGEQDSNFFIGSVIFMAAKRIYQIAKEFERDEKEIIEFLTGQGIKVSNRLSAVSEETFNLLKAKYTAPPEPEPEPEPIPEPAPVVEKTAQPAPSDASTEQTPAPAKKKKKKKKKKSGQITEEELIAEYEAEEAAQGAQDVQGDTQPASGQTYNAATRAVYHSAIAAGNAFIKDYRMGMTKKQFSETKTKLTYNTDSWAVLQELKFDYPDTSAARYWQAMNKLSTRAFKLMNAYGLSHREILGELRNLTAPLGAEYEPKEIFTDEENQLFAEQQKLLFRIFGHGMGKVNDNLFDMKIHAEHMKLQYEMMNFVSYLTDPADPLRCENRVPFADMVDAVVFSVSGVARRVKFYESNKERIINIIKLFFDWRDDYAKLKEQGAPAEKLEKHLELEKKFVDLVEFMALDNLLGGGKKKIPFDIILSLLIDYRDNMDDPDAKRNFQYKVRGVTNLIYKPKEYIFIYRFAGLEAGKDYRPPEEQAVADEETNSADE